MSLFGLLVTAVLFVPIALLVLLDSRGPVLFRQERMGKGGTTFKVIKFRTMVNHAESDGRARFATQDDVRITKIGRLLRKTYIDELPQWWNVLVGDMSAVGPRPELPELTAEISKRFPTFVQRTLTKPGITGLAQIQMGYVDTVAGSKRKLDYDLIYIRNAGLGLDLKICFLTVLRMIRRAGT